MVSAQINGENSPVLTTLQEVDAPIVLVGRDSIVECTVRLMEACRDTADSMLPYTPTREAMDASIAHDIDMLRRGVRGRLLALDSGPEDDYLAWRAKVMAQNGASLRVCPDIKVRLIIFDSKVAVIYNEKGMPEYEPSAQVISSPGVVAALESHSKHCGEVQ
jgi:hypothetical protein